jgi:hypothetical protein
MRRAIAVLLGLIAGALSVVTLGAYVFSSFCWEYCEPEDAPTTWDALKFALPFGILALGLMTAAVLVWTRASLSWPRSVGLGLGLCVAAGLLCVGVLAVFA